jgi:putative ABC transport system ATP-binding protein
MIRGGRFVLKYRKHGPCLSLKNVNKAFGDGKTEFLALKSIDLTFFPTGFYFVTGKSGSGKSTLLNVIGGLEKSTSGSVETPKGTRFA